jgi:hypothetical protein
LKLLHIYRTCEGCRAALGCRRKTDRCAAPFPMRVLRFLPVDPAPHRLTASPNIARV